MVDSFKPDHEGEDSEDIIKNNSIGNTTNIGDVSTKKSVKGGTIPTQVKKFLMDLMPLAAAQIIRTCVQSFEDSLVDSPELLDFEVSAGKKGSLKQRLYNKHRKHTRCFHNPANGHYYISLTSKAFKSFISKHLGSVADCYIMQTTDLGKGMEVITVDSLLDVNNESDIEEYDVSPRRSKNKSRYQGKDMEDDEITSDDVESI